MNLFKWIKAQRIIAGIYMHALPKRAAVMRGGVCKKSRRWYRCKLAGGKASDGSPFYGYYKKGTVNKLVVYFAGGGLSWNQETAARRNTIHEMIAGELGYYFSRVEGWLDMTFTGIVDPQDSRNPFNDWNFIYVPYATGDFHAGNNDYPYTGLDGRPHVLHHRGAENTQRVLEASPAEFRSPEQLFIAGESAGAWGCVANAGRIARFFPNCKDITVYSDAAQITYSKWKEVVRDVWQAEPALYECLREDGQLIRDWFIKLREELGERVVLLHSNSAYDETLAQLQNKMQNDAYVLDEKALKEFHRDLCAVTRELEQQLPNYHYFICDHGKDPATGKTAHTTSRWPPRYYDAKVDDISLAEWLAQAVNEKHYRNVGRDLLTE
ncbi:hypothetical protein FACS189483_04030 [Spirochaetia bacterium]|nr:hypothetical protein FACS189483_04030 [Spirochaetia bacterium]